VGLLERLGRAVLTDAPGSAPSGTAAKIDGAAAADALGEHRRALAVVALAVIGLDIADWTGDPPARRHFDRLRAA